ncbi:hypothetical protein BaRGS_00025163 [Batillaria attramentaria]|uniref:Uncharacterized protein n=1 Tax=Batillaria attramentaria TaxID=370345 RepID=A0ABD0K937_9CAEN
MLHRLAPRKRSGQDENRKAHGYTPPPDSLMKTLVSRTVQNNQLCSYKTPDWIKILFASLTSTTKKKPRYQLKSTGVQSVEFFGFAFHLLFELNCGDPCQSGTQPLPIHRLVLANTR